MKKLVLRWILLVFLFSLFIPAALANSWGLTGDLLGVVMNDERWNDYSAISKQQGDWAVMGSRYHNVLMRHRDGELLTYPLAVWQETDKMKVPRPTLEFRQTDQMLTLSYGADETYMFAMNYEFDLYDIADALVYAKANGLEFHRNGYGFTVSYGETTVQWQRNVLLKDFNIKLFPRSIEEVRRLNRMYAVLSSADRLGTNLQGTLWKGSASGTAPVYSAPFGDSAWRAAKGKAAVGLSGEYWVLGAYCNTDSEFYWKIRYEVSERTQRIGFVRAEDVDYHADSPQEDLTRQMIHISVETISGTWLTDDPMVSQYQQFYVPPGTQFTCMGLYNDYAYVAGEVKNGSFVDGGKPVTKGDQIVWGYVPLRDLGISSESLYRNTVEWNAMAQFAGHWVFASGGVGIDDHLMLYADGTWEGYPDEPSGGTWRLTGYDPGDNLYWTHVSYEITFFRDNGTVRTYGFRPGEDGTSFSLLYWEGSGGYERMDEPFTPPEEGGNG